jgi:hypothetical protein
VYWQRPQQDGDGIVFRVLPRYSEFQRSDKKNRGTPATLAANVDQILAVAAPLPPLNAYLVDRCLATAIQMFTAVRDANTANQPTGREGDYAGLQNSRDTEKAADRRLRSVARSERARARTTAAGGASDGVLAGLGIATDKDGGLGQYDRDELIEMSLLSEAELKEKEEATRQALIGQEQDDVGSGSSSSERMQRRKQPSTDSPSKRGAVLLGGVPELQGLQLAGPETAVIVLNKTDLLPSLEVCAHSTGWFAHDCVFHSGGAAGQDSRQHRRLAASRLQGARSQRDHGSRAGRAQGGAQQTATRW